MTALCMRCCFSCAANGTRLWCLCGSESYVTWCATSRWRRMGDSGFTGVLEAIDAAGARDICSRVTLDRGYGTWENMLRGLREGMRMLTVINTDERKYHPFTAVSNDATRVSLADHGAPIRGMAGMSIDEYTGPHEVRCATTVVKQNGEDVVVVAVACREQGMDANNDMRLMRWVSTLDNAEAMCKKLVYIPAAEPENTFPVLFKQARPCVDIHYFSDDDREEAGSPQGPAADSTSQDHGEECCPGEEDTDCDVGSDDGDSDEVDEVDSDMGGYSDDDGNDMVDIDDGGHDIIEAATTRADLSGVVSDDAQLQAAVERALRYSCAPLTTYRRDAAWIALRRFHLTGRTATALIGRCRKLERAQAALARVQATGAPARVESEKRAAALKANEAFYKQFATSWFARRRATMDMRLGHVGCQACRAIVSQSLSPVVARPMKGTSSKLFTACLPCKQCSSAACSKVVSTRAGLCRRLVSLWCEAVTIGAGAGLSRRRPKPESPVHAPPIRLGCRCHSALRGVDWVTQTSSDSFLSCRSVARCVGVVAWCGTSTSAMPHAVVASLA